MKVGVALIGSYLLQINYSLRMNKRNLRRFIDLQVPLDLLTWRNKNQFMFIFFHKNNHLIPYMDIEAYVILLLYSNRL
ncbi:hypothetical protein PAECIP111893_03127 [Paenibacillus plantiphilus]|uniref:Uncharacterized protein n=1 Tax=Paenibacillus plantiphilus TaxID=2905650 RepID=A0ABN8GP02_9BACL|nr:hypothetical protein PAECIP111893_03127 [Paenibacillus plantiphilus]